MRYQISHTTTYRYDHPVQLGAHTVRLRPRSDGSQMLRQFSINVQPQPDKLSDVLDLDGNACLKLWFPKQSISELSIYTEATVETFRTNPFNYLSEPWAIAAPIDYPSSIAAYLTPYLQPALSTVLSPQVVTFAQTLLSKVEGNVSFFLSQLTQNIYDEFDYLHRPKGTPQPAHVTLIQKSGSCRDFAVLFMAACQAVGLAARFVSGYQEGDTDQESRELHAWPEVYIPGGGWRGFDPTHGLAVSDRHIALAAAAHPAAAAPVSGHIKSEQCSQSTLSYTIRISPLA
ncbi:transglutaminase family protein [Oscillatoria sp. CS-180]|uniref:transglutaminase family protein n=1 Tax=Oscillatoria sp. CS-180 TaxID=3021720 RepID=UPI00232FCA9B|nr:transglutaminase family protein [Oscillatoria sp. CS-180]MDB9525839.1 transglutaminase family protein [Oscillatoria sp. CS-180]